MGLAAAYQALKDGHTVEVLEGAPEPGGMAAHFDLGGLSIERYYHFICKDDFDTFRMLDDLGIRDRLRWRTTSMGIYIDGALHPWGNPIALLGFPAISLLSRLRYAFFAWVCVRRDRWDALERQTAGDWIRRWCGIEVYERLWHPLFDLKFFQYADNISAAWIWTRIRRIGRSRRSLMQEELGYLEGGSETLVRALTDAIQSMGGTVRLGCPAQQVVVEDGCVEGVETPAGLLRADAVISTVPTPFVSSLVPSLSAGVRAQYDGIHNIGICCLVFKLKRSVSPHFWVNTSSPDIPVPGIIEFSNLRPIDGASVVYVPYYMPVTHEKFSWTDRKLLDEAFAFLQLIQPELRREDILSESVARLRHAQPICEPGFLARLPPVQTEIRGLQIADTCFYYPEDRGISQSLRLGRLMASAVPL